MKENSREEDIEIVESIIEEYENCSVPEIDMQVNVTFREKQNNALNHILSDLKNILSMLEEKDQILDLMAEEFKEKTLMYSDFTKEEVKQYFENKAKELLNK